MCLVTILVQMSERASERERARAIVDIVYFFLFFLTHRILLCLLSDWIRKIDDTSMVAIHLLSFP